MHKEYFDSTLMTVLEELHTENLQLKNKISEKDKRHLSEESRIRSLSAELKAAMKRISSLKEEIDALTKEAEEFRKLYTECSRNLNAQLEAERKEKRELKKKYEEAAKELKRFKVDRTVSADSTNSNTPPSQDPFRRKGSKRTRSGRHVGGQAGHPAHIRKHVKPDSVVTVLVREAPDGAVEKKDENGDTYYCVQKIGCRLETTVTEYRYYIDSEHGIKLPAAVMKRYRISGFAYAASLKAAVLYLNNRGAIALARLSSMVRELSGGRIDIKPSTIVKWNREFARLSEAERGRIAIKLLESDILHVDETGWNIDGKLEWMHAVSNGRETLYFMTDERGGADGPIGFLRDYHGIIIHDHFKCYYTRLPENMKHGECNAHIERALQRGIDEYDSAACREMYDLLQSALSRKKELTAQGKSAMDSGEIKEIVARYEMILRTELTRYSEENPKITAKTEADYIKLFRRMLAYRDEHLRFISDFRVPFTNTTAERCMRTVKSKKKISGQSKNMERGKDYADMMTVVQTCSWRKENTLEKMSEIMETAEASDNVG